MNLDQKFLDKSFLVSDLAIAADYFDCDYNSRFDKFDKTVYNYCRNCSAKVFLNLGNRDFGFNGVCRNRDHGNSLDFRDSFGHDNFESRVANYFGFADFLTDCRKS